MPSTPVYDTLTRTFDRLHRLFHLKEIACWDQATMMPPGGNEARAGALAELGGLIHAMMTDAEFGRRLSAAEDEDLDDMARANLREMRREWERTNLLPADLVKAQTLARARCEHAWRSQRPANDWPGLRENLREVVRLAREEGRRLAEGRGIAPYQALMDKFEPGMTTERLETLFSDIKTWLPGLIAAVRDKQAGETWLKPAGPFPVEAQRALCREAMALLGFDFSAGRLDVSEHPFCGGVPEDVRITTRYREDDFVQSLMGIIHETGHARYEQRLPRGWLGQPVGRARSMGIHESQSLAFEMQLARHPAFVGLLAPLARRHLGERPELSGEQLAALLTRVEPGFIRVDADELCYPAHVILRFEIESALIDGAIEVDDIPALWDDKMAAYLGLDTRGNHADGCMQDIHWPSGDFGYFPSYTLGAMYAAQFFAAMRREHPDLDRRIADGDLSVVFDWLDKAVWSQGCRWTTDELVRRATGGSLDPTHFRTHLEARYLGG